MTDTPASESSLAAAATPRAVAVAWSSGTSVEARLLDAAGVTISSKSMAGAATRVAVAWSGSSFGVAYTGSGGWVRMIAFTDTGVDAIAPDLIGLAIDPSFGAFQLLGRPGGGFLLHARVWTGGRLTPAIVFVDRTFERTTPVADDGDIAVAPDGRIGHRYSDGSSNYFQRLETDGAALLPRRALAAGAYGVLRHDGASFVVGARISGRVRILRGDELETSTEVAVDAAAAAPELGLVGSGALTVTWPSGAAGAMTLSATRWRAPVADVVVTAAGGPTGGVSPGVQPTGAATGLLPWLDRRYGGVGEVYLRTVTYPDCP